MNDGKKKQEEEEPLATHTQLNAKISLNLRQMHKDVRQMKKTIKKQFNKSIVQKQNPLKQVKSLLKTMKRQERRKGSYSPPKKRYPSITAFQNKIGLASLTHSSKDDSALPANRPASLLQGLNPLNLIKPGSPAKMGATQGTFGMTPGSPSRRSKQSQEVLNRLGDLLKSQLVNKLTSSSLRELEGLSEEEYTEKVYLKLLENLLNPQTSTELKEQNPGLFDRVQKLKKSGSVIEQNIYRGNQQILTREDNFQNLTKDPAKRVKREVGFMKPIPQIDSHYEEVKTSGVDSSEFRDFDHYEINQSIAKRNRRKAAQKAAKRKFTDISKEGGDNTMTRDKNNSEHNFLNHPTMQAKHITVRSLEDSMESVQDESPRSRPKKRLQERKGDGGDIDPEEGAFAEDIIPDDHQEIIKILTSQYKKSDHELQMLFDFICKFDFLKKQQMTTEKETQVTISKKNEPIPVQEKPQGMRKDKKSIEQMVAVMKYVKVPKYNLVFDFESQGDLFYMVVHGSILCKIPIFKQLIHLSQEEFRLFVEQYKEDLISITEAHQVNDAVRNGKNPEINTMQVYPNPYDLPREELADLLADLQHREKFKILRSHRDAKNKKKALNLGIQTERQKRQIRRRMENQLMKMLGLEVTTDSKQTRKRKKLISSIVKSNRDTLSSSIQDSASGSQFTKQTSQVQILSFEGKDLSPDESLALAENQDLAFLKDACSSLLYNYVSSKTQRKYYFVSILKVVHVYQPYESFGELALITNKRRAAKLEVTGESDAHFAVLSKKDYRQAQFKIQKQFLDEKMKFLKQFEIFRGLSDQGLSGLSYQMQEIVCSRGQEIYTEGVDRIHNIYLVKEGEFECHKKMEVHHGEIHEEMRILLAEIEKRKSSEAKIDLDELSKLRQDLRRMVQQRSNNYFKGRSGKADYDNVKVCVHSTNDVFGFQELMNDKIQFREQSVRCIAHGSVIVRIHKSNLAGHVRRNPVVLNKMIEQWNDLLAQRTENHLLIQSQTKLKSRFQRRLETLDQHEAVNFLKECEQRSLNFEMIRNAQMIKDPLEPRVELNEPFNQDSIFRATFSTRKHHSSSMDITRRSQPSKEVVEPTQDTRPSVMTKLSTLLKKQVKNFETTQKFLQVPTGTQEFGSQVEDAHSQSLTRAQQSMYDNQFKDFRRTLFSSLSQKEFDRVRSIQERIDKQVIHQKVQGMNLLNSLVPESVQHSNEKLRLCYGMEFNRKFKQSTVSKKLGIRPERSHSTSLFPGDSMMSTTNKPQPTLPTAAQFQSLQPYSHHLQSNLTSLPAIPQPREAAGELELKTAGVSLQQSQYLGDKPFKFDELPQEGIPQMSTTAVDHERKAFDPHHLSTIQIGEATSQFKNSVVNAHTSSTTAIPASQLGERSARSDFEGRGDQVEWNLEVAIAQTQCSKYFASKQSRDTSRRSKKDDETLKEDSANNKVVVKALDTESSQLKAPNFQENFTKLITRFGDDIKTSLATKPETKAPSQGDELEPATMVVNVHTRVASPSNEGNTKINITINNSNKKKKQPRGADQVVLGSNFSRSDAQVRTYYRQNKDSHPLVAYQRKDQTRAGVSRAPSTLHHERAAANQSANTSLNDPKGSEADSKQEVLFNNPLIKENMPPDGYSRYSYHERSLSGSKRRRMRIYRSRLGEYKESGKKKMGTSVPSQKNLLQSSKQLKKDSLFSESMMFFKDRYPRTKQGASPNPYEDQSFSKQSRQSRQSRPRESSRASGDADSSKRKLFFQGTQESLKVPKELQEPKIVMRQSVFSNKEFSHKAIEDQNTRWKAKLLGIQQKERHKKAKRILQKAASKVVPALEAKMVTEGGLQQPLSVANSVTLQDILRKKKQKGLSGASRKRLFGVKKPKIEKNLDEIINEKYQHENLDHLKADTNSKSQPAQEETSKSFNTFRYSVRSSTNSDRSRKSSRKTKKFKTRMSEMVEGTRFSKDKDEKPRSRFKGQNIEIGDHDSEQLEHLDRSSDYSSSGSDSVLPEYRLNAKRRRDSEVIRIMDLHKEKEKTLFMGDDQQVIDD